MILKRVSQECYLRYPARRTTRKVSCVARGQLGGEQRRPRFHARLCAPDTGSSSLFLPLAWWSSPALSFATI
jgi:hypothetical protein